MRWMRSLTFSGLLFWARNGNSEWWWWWRAEWDKERMRCALLMRLFVVYTLVFSVRHTLTCSNTSAPFTNFFICFFILSIFQLYLLTFHFFLFVVFVVVSLLIQSFKYVPIYCLFSFIFHLRSSAFFSSFDIFLLSFFSPARDGDVKKNNRIITE